MKHHNLLVGMILTAMLICFLAIPQKTIAADFNFFNFGSSEDYQVLSEFESKRIIEEFPGILYKKWFNLSSDGYSEPKERTVISLLKELSTLNLWNYYFRDLPIDVSLAVAKQSVEISKLVATEDVSGVLGKIEKETAKAAVSYLKEYFFKNQIKVSFGAMEVKYKTETGPVDSPFQYIIMYQPINDEKGRVVARIYSPKEIIPPPSRGSLGLTKGFLNSMEKGQNIPPFIVEISGEMRKGMYGSYFWNGDPEIKTIFPEKVPDFGLKPRTWQEKYIINPIKDRLSGILSFGQLLGFQTESVDYLLGDGSTEKIEEEIKDIKENGDVEKKYPEEKEESVKIVEQKIEEIKKDDVKKEEAKEEIKIKEKKEEKVAFSSCSKNIPHVPKHNIIFNEVAWMGSKSSANDEWMELKNVSDKDINLKGYTISDKGDQIKIVFDNYLLPAGGLVLLERTDDASVPLKQADMIYQGALSNSGEELYLFDSSCTAEDYVLANPDWPAGESEERRTMERAADFIWLTYSGEGIDNIWGTPKEANSPGRINKKESKKETNSNSISLSASSVGGPTAVETSYCSQSNLSSPTRQIVINEVAWMGSESSSADEWIELKNVSEETISLSNWQLLDQGNQIKVVFSSSETISPGGFYLLERSDDDNSVPNIVADKKYFNSLSDTDESLRLFDSNCSLVDEVLANPDWPAGNKTEKRTMERNDDLGWHTYSSVVDVISGLWGTPKAANSLEAEGNQEDDPEQEDPIQEDEEETVVPGLLITEVQIDGDGGHEYIELFNQSGKEIDFCPEEKNCYYLSYYSSTSEWLDPHRNWKFPDGAVLPINSYYIIDVFGDSGGDWRLETAEETDEEHYYGEGQLSTSGALAVFFHNPRYDGEEEKTDEEQINRAISLKIDAVGWSNNETPVIVKEGEQFIGSKKDSEVIGRKWSVGQYLDSDNNADDFQLEIPSPRSHAPRPPSKVENLSASLNPEQKNSVILSWSASEDEDTSAEDIGYEIYYSRNGQIDENNLLNIDGYVAVEIIDGEENVKKATIPDLYYDSTYSFAVKAKDPEKNYSPLSDISSLPIEEAVHQKQAPYYDFRRSGRSNFTGPTNENMSEAIVYAQGVDTNSNNDNLSFISVIDENGTVYFYGEIDGLSGIYAYNSNGKKWVYHGEEFLNEPSLGKDGSIYTVDSRSVYCLSPSGKLEWKEDFEKVYTKNIIIDSEGRIYFIASESPNNAVLFAFDGETRVPVYPIGSLLNINYSELVLDENDNIFFSKENTVFKLKFGFGIIAEKTIPVLYDSSYTGEKDKTDATEQVYVAFDGTVLVNVLRGNCCYNVNRQLNVFYALKNDLSDIIWFKKEYGSVIGIGDGEFYMSMLRPGFWENMAVSLVDGSIKWTKGPFFPQSSMVVSDSGSNIYFTQNFRVLGYDSQNIKDGVVSNDTVLFFSGAEQYCYTPLSIGNGVMYISKFKEMLVIKY